MGVRKRLESPRFRWSVFHGRCRRRLIVGLLLMMLALLYGGWAGHRFSRRGNDAEAFDRPVVRMATRLSRLHRDMRTLRPENDREMYLFAVIGDQNDLLFGLTAFSLRMVFVLTFAGLGIVLLAAASTEWEIRSELIGEVQGS